MVCKNYRSGAVSGYMLVVVFKVPACPPEYQIMTGDRYQIRLRFIHYILDNFIIYKEDDILLFSYEELSDFNSLKWVIVKNENDVHHYYRSLENHQKAKCILHIDIDGEPRLDFQDNYLHFICLGENKIYANDIIIENDDYIQIIHDEYQNLLDFLNGKDPIQRLSNC